MDKKLKWEKIGVAGVDSGALMISDPCYADMVHKWNSENFSLENQLNYPTGHSGLGVQAPTAHGDGVYPVYALRYPDSDRALAMLVVTDSDVEELVKRPF